MSKENGGCPQTQHLPEVYAQLNLRGNSRAFQQALHVIERIAAVDATVLIQGETGTGKELAARALHYLSRRRDFPFIPVNCGALPDTLVESELFGHVRGAFTDAKEPNQGLVSQAERGTLFLDEVEAMTPRAQVVLLRFLQDHKYRQVGGRLFFSGNVRVIASTNIDIEELVLHNAFRRDLLFRLSILSVTMPPLRHREGDVVSLAEYFLQRFAVEYGRPAKRLHADTVTSLMAYDWPGNVRELENLMLRELLMAEGEEIRIDPQRHGAVGSNVDGGFAPAQTFKSAKARAIALFEKSYLGQLLTTTAGNVSLAARISGKDRGSLNKLIKKHGLAGEHFRSSSD